MSAPSSSPARPRLEVRPAAPHEWRTIGATLGRSFLDDPVWNWLSPHAARRERGFAGILGRFALDRARQGTAWTTPGRSGAALWAAPGRWHTQWWSALPWAGDAYRAFGPDGLARSLRMNAALERAHPKVPHWYLEVLGTDPDLQGRGIGAALIEPVLQRCDRDGVGAYLESSKAANVGWYERHGFTVVDQLHHTPGAPPFWLMWRDPR